MSLRCQLFVSDMNEGYEDFACNVGAVWNSRSQTDLS